MLGMVIDGLRTELTGRPDCREAAGAGGTAGTSRAALDVPAPPADPWLDAYPLVPASAGAMIFDRAGRLLILNPTYKSGWTIPGGVMEADGESPWQACRREVREETGLDVTSGRLACVDSRPKTATRAASGSCSTAAYSATRR
jgi:hypothetical protein